VYVIAMFLVCYNLGNREFLAYPSSTSACRSTTCRGFSPQPRFRFGEFSRIAARGVGEGHRLPPQQHPLLAGLDPHAAWCATAGSHLASKRNRYVPCLREISTARAFKSLG